MQAPKSLRRPSNWQDFETLCKKLWGEIWNCSEIKKNGRNGQSQNGVDIYGIPKGEIEYYGIQCKGKDVYNEKQFTEEEITGEIEKAKSFSPKLKKLYFATTALKDVKIEAFVRNKNIENLKNNLFEVHLFSWEDIVDLIDENRITHNWYLNLQRFKQNSDVLICFENDKNELTGLVLFCEQYTHFVLGQEPSSMFDYTPYKLQQNIVRPLFKRENKSFFRFRIKIKNIGSAPIENPKVIIQANGNHEKIGNELIASPFVSLNAKNDIEFNEIQENLFINLHRNALAPEEEYISNIICIKPKHEGTDVELSWKLISNNFKKEGLLKININTSLIRKDIDKYVDFRQHVRVEKNIVDYFEEDE